jgi:acetyltransferase-like isoleucine patch superfamily enzyme
VGKYVTIEVDGLIGDGTIIGNNVGIVGRFDHDSSFIGLPISRAPWVGDQIALSRAVEIGSDVWIGYGAIVLSGVKVGSSSVIAAGAVVVTDVPVNTVVAGVPARVVRERYSSSELERHWSTLTKLGYEIAELS